MRASLDHGAERPSCLVSLPSTPGAEPGMGPLALCLGRFPAPHLGPTSPLAHVGPSQPEDVPCAPFSGLMLGGVQGQGSGSEAPLPLCPPVCLDDSFGPDCSLTCADCRKGGTCLPSLRGCDCPDGWTGLVCSEGEAAVRAGCGRGP